MSSGRSCVNCTFAAMEMDDNGPAMECHRHPPVSLLEPVKPLDDSDPELTAEYETLVQIEQPGRYPRVRVEDWCGEWKEVGSW
jgi:hypothetical protein